jgi:tetratricopeptide (TPR) repeat protein
MHKLALIVLLCTAVQAQEQLGTIVFPNSGKPEAQAAFLRGVLLLHNFAYPQAERAFVEAEKIDPNFAMAYWGEAMTHNHPLWNQFDGEGGKRVLGQLTPLKSVTARERGYIEAVEALYGGGDKAVRDSGYEKAMERLARTNPDDVEAQVFWALSILGSRGWHKIDPRRSMRAAAILEELFPMHADHPGVLHYLIHAYDDPIHAPLGLRAARRYAKVASSAPHALHMPSHIFFQLGMWDDAARSNEAAYALSKEWVAREHTAGDKHDLHSLIWLQYVYLQQHRYSDAKRLLDEVEPSEGDGRETMQLRYAVETGEWSAFDFAHFVGRTLRAIAEKRFDDAQRAIDELSSKKNSDHHGDHYEVSAPEPDELRALLASARGAMSEALHYAQLAVATESSLDDVLSGPPDDFKPANELYGELLLQAGKPKEALQEFETSLLRTPNRAASVAGLKRAQAALTARTSM